MGIAKSINCKTIDIYWRKASDLGYRRSGCIPLFRIAPVSRLCTH